METNSNVRYINVFQTSSAYISVNLTNATSIYFTKDTLFSSSIVTPFCYVAPTPQLSHPFHCIALFKGAPLPPHYIPPSTATQPPCLHHSNSTYIATVSQSLCKHVIIVAPSHRHHNQYNQSPQLSFSIVFGLCNLGFCYSVVLCFN